MTAAADGEAESALLSVVVPTHDRRRLLERKLRTIEAHAGELDAVGFEVVVIADACGDDTEAFLRSYSPSYPLRWTATAGIGAAAARNRGARVARGRVLLFTDDDVVPRPGWLSAHATAHAGVDADPLLVGAARLVLPPHIEHGAVRSGATRWWNLGSASLSLRADLFARAGGYDERFSAYGGEDPELGYRLRALGARFATIEAAVAEHWDEDYARDLERKAHAAGRAHVRVWRLHGDARIGFALGVHPVALGLKRVVLGGAAAAGVRRPWVAYERAYLEGARAELGAPGEGTGTGTGGGIGDGSGGGSVDGPVDRHGDGRRDGHRDGAG